MYLLITVGGYIGALPTIGCVMLTAVVGVALLRWQGLATLARGIGRANAGELPAQEIAEGMLLAVAGALLLTPGFMTDAIGFVLLVPAGRQLVVRWLRSRVQVVTPAPGPGDRNGGDGPVTIDGDYERR